MGDDRSTALDLTQLLEAVEGAPPVDAADVLARRLAEALGATEVSFLIADFSGNALVRLEHAGADDATRTRGRETAERVAIAGTPQGRALTGQRVEVDSGADGARVYAPVTNRGEAIGVLELALPGTPDAQTIADLARAAHALAYVIIANGRFTDLYAWGQRSVPLSLAAEIQHRLLPAAYTCEAGQCTLSAWLEPAGDVGGDTFDFILDRDLLHLSMTDAMGHDVESAILATVLVGSLRNARRAGATLVQQARTGSAALFDYIGDGSFVTGQLVRIDLRTETATVVNAGHPLPLRMRGGAVEEIALEADPPFGTVAGHAYRTQALAFEPGDRVLFFTDGILDDAPGAVDIEAHLLATAHLHPREAVQELVRTVRVAAGGPLRDDATAMCVDWHGGGSQPRSSDGGADAATASHV